MPETDAFTEALKTRLARAEGRIRLLEETLEEKTQRLHRANNKVLKFKTYAEQAIDMMPIGILVLSRDKTILRVNTAAEYLLSAPRQELVGRSVDVLGDEEDLLRPGREESSATHGMRTWRTKDGDKVHVLLSVVTMPGEILGQESYVCFAQDVTSERELQQALEESRDTLDAIVNNSTAVICAKDLDDRYVFVNRAFEELVHRPAAEIVGHKTQDLFPPEACDQYRENDRRVIEENGSLEFEEVVPQADGPHTYISLKFPLRDRYGKPYAVCAVSTDITQRKREMEETARLAMVLEQMGESVVITDTMGTIQYVNPAFERVTGYSRTEAVGKNPRILKSGEQTPEFYRELWETITAGRVWSGRFHNRRKDGTIFVEEATISPVVDEHGSIVNFVAVKNEISEKLELETQLRQAQKLEAIGQLAAGIAHEINTPTQYISDNTVFLKRAFQGLVEVMERFEPVLRAAEEGSADTESARQVREAFRKTKLDFLLEEVPRALDQSLEGLDRVRKIVTAMKEFSHPSQGKKEHVDLAEAITTTLTVARNEWKYVAEMETEFDPSLPPVPVLRDEFNQVILNIVVNAAHAIGETRGEGDGKGKITVRTRRDGEWAEISISDTGAGIPEKLRNRIFDPFFTTKEVGKGTGQGLAIARSVVVDKHGGDISVDSTVGEGTTFVIRLPLQEPDAEKKEKAA